MPKTKQVDGNKRSSIDHFFAPQQDRALPKAIPLHNHQLEGSGRTHASCIAGIPAITVASVLATIAGLDPSFHRQISAITIPITEIVSTAPHSHTPFIKRIIVTRKAPRANPAGSHGRLLPAVKQFIKIMQSKTVHIIQLTTFCGMSCLAK